MSSNTTLNPISYQYSPTRLRDEPFYFYLFPFALFDYLVCIHEHSRWNCKVKSLGRLQIDDQLEFRRLLDRQVSRLSSLEDFVYVVRGAAVHFRQSYAIGHQTTFIDKLADGVHRG